MVGRFVPATDVRYKRPLAGNDWEKLSSQLNDGETLCCLMDLDINTSGHSRHVAPYVNSEFEFNSNLIWMRENKYHVLSYYAV